MRPGITAFLMCLYMRTRGRRWQALCVTLFWARLPIPDLHAGPVLAALDNGKYVYTEKPLSITLEDCLAIVRADRAAGGRVAVGFNLRLCPFLHRCLHEEVAIGKLGRILTIQADEFYYGGKTYFRRWNRLRRCGGGLWITKASHDLDLLYWMAGSLPVSVSALAHLTHYVPKPGAGETPPRLCD